MKCAKGCAMCCHGLFDIGLPDTLELTAAIKLLEPDVWEQVMDRARGLQAVIQDEAPKLGMPYVFGSADDPGIDSIVERTSEAPCPLLGSDGSCLVYEHRPMACRAEGLPLVDTRDGLFSDWYELNFTQAGSGESFGDLTRDWTAVTETEEATARAIARESATEIASSNSGTDRASITVSIPSLIVVYESF